MTNKVLYDSLVQFDQIPSHLIRIYDMLFIRFSKILCIIPNYCIVFDDIKIINANVGLHIYLIVTASPVSMCVFTRQ